MPSWKDIQTETKAIDAPHDIVRRKYLLALSQLTGRNVIAYYSGWQHITEERQFYYCGVDDSDTNGFMAAIHNLNRKKGLDLVLHTPGGEMGATESLVEYLRDMFGTDIRAIVPHLALSAGTMIALSCNQIVMGKHSRLGPIDPQIGSLAAQGVLQEFERAAKEIRKSPEKAVVWQPIIAKYSPTLIGECEQAIVWAREMVQRWLETGMFRKDRNRRQIAGRIVATLSNPRFTRTHARELPLKEVRRLGIKTVKLEDDPALQDAVLSVHHACVQSLSRTSAVKIIDNQIGGGIVATMEEIVRQDFRPGSTAH